MACFAEVAALRCEERSLCYIHVVQVYGQHACTPATRFLACQQQHPDGTNVGTARQDSSDNVTTTAVVAAPASSTQHGCTGVAVYGRGTPLG